MKAFKVKSKTKHQSISNPKIFILKVKKHHDQSTKSTSLLAFWFHPGFGTISLFLPALAFDQRLRVLTITLAFTTGLFAFFWIFSQTCNMWIAAALNNVVFGKPLAKSFILIFARSAKSRIQTFAFLTVFGFDVVSTTITTIPITS